MTNPDLIGTDVLFHSPRANLAILGRVIKLEPNFEKTAYRIQYSWECNKDYRDWIEKHEDPLTASYLLRGHAVQTPVHFSQVHGSTCEKMSTPSDGVAKSEVSHPTAQLELF